MSKRQYPRQAWVLLPSFKPKEVTITKPYGSMSSVEDWDMADSGKSYHKDSLFPSMAEAISHGRDQVEKLKADLAKRQDTLNKRIAALDKAEGKEAAAAEASKGGA